jgi:hypothetical protein
MKSHAHSRRIHALKIAALQILVIFALGAKPTLIGIKNSSTSASAPMPLDQLGPKVDKQYQGDGLSVTPTAKGAKLRCVLQRLEGEVTPEGLWITSTAGDVTGERFRVIAVAVRREGADSQPSPGASDECLLPRTGKVIVAKQLARLIRPGLTEEYSVSADGIRQDFVIAMRPEGDADLRVELLLSGAQAESAEYGAKFVVDGSGRELAYGRVLVEDATGLKLNADLEVLSADRLAVRVSDADATYPLRIDPTFTDADWVSLNPGMPGADFIVNAVAVDGGGNVYFGGDFIFIGTVPANNIAKWDGSGWSTLGAGVDSTTPTGGRTVMALAVIGTDLYVGGDFDSAGGVSISNIAKWDGNGWAALGSGISDRVNALAVMGTDIYAGGVFTTAGGMQAKRIAKWDGGDWSALGAGMNFPVRALAAIGNDLYAGGDFTLTGGVQANKIAMWDGNNWSALGSGLGGSARDVYALAAIGTDLYAGGSFLTAGGVTAEHVAKWDGTGWSALGSIVNGWVRSLAVIGTDLYAGGDFGFTGAGGSEAHGIAKWDGNEWSALGSELDPNSSVRALAVNGTDLYAKPTFSTPGGDHYSSISKWDGAAWSTLSPGMNRTVQAITVSGPNVYAAGTFTTAAGPSGSNSLVIADHVAQWNGQGWSALGTGIRGSSHTDMLGLALATIGNDIYVGGEFYIAGGQGARNIARWDGTGWSALGSGLGGSAGEVYALAVIGTDLYAGGNFLTAGGVTAEHVAKWDGNAWAALGSGTDGEVMALAVIGTELYAGGSFNTAGGMPIAKIARWDGSGWSALGPGITGTVYALAVKGTDLYAGGVIGTAGGLPASNIAKWNGSSWSPLGLGVNNRVTALAVVGADLYVGGRFTTAGGIPAKAIANWDGSSWTALGSGVQRGSSTGIAQGWLVYALAAGPEGQLFVGGTFHLAGNTVSPFIAQANVSIPAMGMVDVLPLSSSANIVRWWSESNEYYNLMRAENLLVGFSQVATDIIGTPPMNTHQNFGVPLADSTHYTVEITSNPPPLPLAIAGPVTNTVNGHTYFLLGQSTWVEAEMAAVSMGGHLATVRNTNEQVFVFNTFGNWDAQPRNLCIGLYDPDMLVNVANVPDRRQEFVWTSGEPVTYTNWEANEPNNWRTLGEFWVHMIEPRWIVGAGMWNDVWNTDENNIGFGPAPLHGVVEITTP